MDFSLHRNADHDYHSLVLVGIKLVKSIKFLNDTFVLNDFILTLRADSKYKHGIDSAVFVGIYIFEWRQLFAINPPNLQ